MLKKSDRKSLQKRAFVPRFAFGCVGVGMSVIPFLTACSTDSADTTDDDAGFTGVLPYIPDAPDADAAFTGIFPYVPDASTDADAAFTGIVPYIPDATTDAAPADADDGDAGDATDASGE